MVGPGRSGPSRKKEAVARRFGFSENDLALTRTWVQNTRIAWGLDAEHRAGLGLPASDSNTWQFGLNRLLLGYATKSGNRTLFGDILAYDEVEGHGGEILGRFVAAVETVSELIKSCQTTRRPQAAQR